MYMIILAAGQGTRLRPLTDNIPKCLVQVKEKAILDWQLQVAQQAGINDIVFYEGGREAALGLKNWFNPSDLTIMGIVDQVNIGE